MSEFIQTLIKTSRIDDPKCWAEDDCLRQPDFDAKAFQKRINKIVGTERGGAEIVRLKWAWDEDCFSLFFTEWNVAGEPTKGELRAKYKYKTVELDSSTRIDICPPRWVLEERIAPEQYAAAWEQNRWQYDKNIRKEVPLRPSAPRTGYYAKLKLIAMHDPEDKCCVRALKANKECFGLYKHPSEIDLVYLAGLQRQIMTHGRPDPYKPLDSATFAAIEAESQSAAQEKDESRQAQREEDRREFTEIVRPLAAFSLPSEKRTPAGLILPN